MTILELKILRKRLLTDIETNWDDQQKMKLKLQLTEKIGNGRKTKDYLKLWDGPCASVDELQLILRQNPDQS